MKRRTVTMRLVLDISGPMTIADAREAVAAKLGTKDQKVKVRKGTLPDPDTIRNGTIHWGSAHVKQRLTR